MALYQAAATATLDLEARRKAKEASKARRRKRHGGDAQFLWTEDEANMTHQKSRTHERKTKQQRLQPGQDTMS